jgi:F0F1-type ATP synthase assembly protein I
VKSLRFLVVLCLLALVGCNGDSVTKPPESAPPAVQAPSDPEPSLVERAQRRKAVAQLKKEELDARDQESAALVEVGSQDREAIDARRKAEQVAAIRGWCFWIEISAIILGVVAGVLILKFTGNVKLALSVAGGCALIAILAYGIGWVLLHLGMVGILAGVAVLLIVAYKVWEHYDELRDFARVTADKVKGAADYTEQLAKAKVLNAETFNKVLTKLKG